MYKKNISVTSAQPVHSVMQDLKCSFFDLDYVTEYNKIT